MTEENEEAIIMQWLRALEGEGRQVEVGARLKSLRAERGWTINEVAKRSSTSSGFVHGVEADGLSKGNRFKNFAKVDAITNVLDGRELLSFLTAHFPIENSASVASGDFEFESLDAPPALTGRAAHLLPVRRLQPGARSRDTWSVHPHEELSWIIEGKCQFVFRDPELEAEHGGEHGRGHFFHLGPHVFHHALNLSSADAYIQTVHIDVVARGPVSANAAAPDLEAEALVGAVEAEALVDPLTPEQHQHWESDIYPKARAKALGLFAGGTAVHRLLDDLGMAAAWEAFVRRKGPEKPVRYWLNETAWGLADLIRRELLHESRELLASTDDDNETAGASQQEPTRLRYDPSAHEENLDTLRMLRRHGDLDLVLVYAMLAGGFSPRDFKRVMGIDLEGLQEIVARIQRMDEEEAG